MELFIDIILVGCILLVIYLFLRGSRFPNKNDEDSEDATG